MSQLEHIREQIFRLYKTAPNIHVNVSLKNPKLELNNVRVRISGVYPHIFQVEEHSSGKPKQHTFQYADIVTKNIVIIELERGKV